MKSTILLFAVLLAGCSTRVEVWTERLAPGDPPATETFSSNVTVDLLADPEQAPRLRSQPPAPTEVKQPEVEVAGTANVAMIVHGDLHVHEHHHDHIHLDSHPAERQPARRRNQEKSQPVEIETRKTRSDPRCERLRREHVEQVARWREMMGL